VRLRLQTYVYSATAAAVVQSRLYVNLVQCRPIVSRHFVYGEKSHIVLCPRPAPDAGDANTDRHRVDDLGRFSYWITGMKRYEKKSVDTYRRIHNSTQGEMS